MFYPCTNKVSICNSSTCCPIWKELDEKNSEESQKLDKLDKHVVLLLINYIASKERRQARVRESPQAFLLRFAQHATGQTL